MTKKKKTILLLSLSFLFLLVIIPVILYSLGYRIDLKEKNIIKVGSFYFRVWPRGVDLSLIPFYKDNLIEEDAIKRKTLFNSIYIENILPKNYMVKVEKDGFYTWQKTLDLKPGTIIESKNITLVKRNPYLDPILEEVKDFYVSPNEKNIILLSKGNIYSLDLTTNKTTLLSIIPKDFENLLFSSNLNKLFLKTKNNYLILNTEDLSLTPLEIKNNIVADPENNEIIYFLEETTLYKQNILTEKKEKIEEGIVSFSIVNNKIIYLDKTGFLIEYNSFRKKINEEPFELKNSEYEIIIIGSDIYLKENDNLYSFDKENKKFNIFLDSVVKTSESYNKEKLLISNKNEIRILFLKRQTDQPLREEKEILFLSRFSEEIRNIFWWNNHYLILDLGGKIKIMEIDNRDKINIYELSNLEISKFYWSRINRKVFILSENNFYISESLVF